MKAPRAATRLPLGVLLVACLGAVGCLPPPSTPPFRPATAGAGFVWETPGLLRRVTVGETVTVQFRRSRGGLRVYGPQMERLGRVRPTLTGWTVYRRDGTSVALASASPQGWDVRCVADETRLQVQGSIAVLPGGDVQVARTGRDRLLQSWEAVAQALASAAAPPGCLGTDAVLVTALLVHLLAFDVASEGSGEAGEGSGDAG